MQFVYPIYCISAYGIDYRVYFLLMQDFSKVIGPLISNPTHMKNMVGCINVILSASTLAVTVSDL